MKPGSLFRLAALLAFSASFAAHATESTSGLPAPIAMEELAARLDLDSGQQARIAPTLQERNDRLKTIAGKADGASRREKLAVVREARAVQQEFVSKVAPLLSKEQNAEWSQLRDETREQFNERRRRK